MSSYTEHLNKCSAIVKTWPDWKKPMNELTIKSDVAIRSEISVRTWRSEPDGPNDKNVDIWYNGKWVPAFFTDIRKGDFWIKLDANLEPDRCFLAASNCTNSGRWNGIPTFIIINGCQIVQAPAMKDIEALELPIPNLLENK